MKSIVVIDDEYIVVEGVKAILARQQLDYEVVGAAYNGIDALKVLRETKPDIVITDIRIPGLDGLSLIEQSREFLSDTDFIVISGYTEFEYARRALSLGVQSYIDKPVTIEKVREALGQIEKNRERRKRRYQPTPWPDTAKRLDEATEGAIRAVMENEPEQLAQCSKELLSVLGEYRLSPEVYCREGYKAVCVIVEIFNEQKEARDRKKVPAYSEFERVASVDRLEYTIREILDGLKAAIEAGKIGGGHQTIKQVLEYIGTHYNQDIGLNELADRVHMNPAYLSLLFKENVGMSYIKYLTGLRIEKAKELLLDGYKVAEVSEMAGYNNYRYFCDIFKKQTGCTPNEYRGIAKK